MSAIDEKRFSALGREWTARFDFNAMCEIEEQHGGRAFLEIVSPMLLQLDEADRGDAAKQLVAVKAIRMADIRMILQQSLQGAQPGTTSEETGRIVSEIGFGAAMAIVAWAVVKALGTQAGDDPAEAGPEGNAPKRKSRPTR